MACEQRAQPAPPPPGDASGGAVSMPHASTAAPRPCRKLLSPNSIILSKIHLFPHQKKKTLKIIKRVSNKLQPARKVVRLRCTKTPAHRGGLSRGAAGIALAAAKNGRAGGSMTAVKPLVVVLGSGPQGLGCALALLRDRWCDVEVVSKGCSPHSDATKPHAALWELPP